MDVMEATQTAKRYIVELFTGEQIANVGLEEVEFDDTRDEWSVTIGFSRPWDSHSPTILSLSVEHLASRRLSERSYKVVRISDESGEVKSLKDRILSASE